MKASIRRVAMVMPVTSAIVAAAPMLVPAMASAAECGPGTVYDAPSNLCVVAPAPDVWDAQPVAPALSIPPELPPISICPPIPFVPVCFPVN